MHAATDTFPGFQPFTEMIGGHFRTHGPQVEVEVINQDAECPANISPRRGPCSMRSTS